MTNQAFVIGSDGSPGIGRLKYARSDARAIAAKLRGPRCGFEVISPANDLRKYEVLAQLERAASACEPDDSFIFYYAGHGDLDKGKLGLVWEENETDIATASLPMDWVLDIISRRCKAQNKLLILDCCHAGAAAPARETSIPLEEVVVPPENFVFLMASRRLQVTREFDDLGGSFLSVKICEALDEQFQKADRDGDQRLSLDDLKTWLEMSWRSLQPQLRAQIETPYQYGQVKGAFYLTQDYARWRPYEIPWPDESLAVILPIRPLGGRALCIGKHPVTNAQYRRFVQSIRYREPVGKRLDRRKNIFSEENWTGGFFPWKDRAFNAPQQPVVCVDYDDANAYCGWVNRQAKSTGRFKTQTRLPSASLWAHAAFGQEYELRDPAQWLAVAPQVYHRAAAPAPIDDTGSRCSAWGICDLIGNVWEWTSSTETTGSSYAGSGYTYYHQVTTQLRGGGFLDDLTKTPPYLATYRLDGQQTSHFDLGFRIAGTVETEDLPEEVQTRLDLQRAGSRELWRSME